MSRHILRKPAPIIAYKGFDLDWSCRGFQYEIGKTYTHDGPVVRCAAGGFHACEMPFDVWNYYPLSTSRMGVVELGGTIHRAENEDTKIAAAEIIIKADISLPAFIKAAVEWVLDRAKGNTATGDGGHAAATGDRGHAAATGDGGHAAATSYRGHAAATGFSGHAAATGFSGHAAATGFSGHAAAIGFSGHAAATGDGGHAAATGFSGHAAATGDGGHAAATGFSGHAAATGYRGHAAATGDRGHAAVKGKNAVAMASGFACTANAEIGGAIMLAAYDSDWSLVAVRASLVGQNGVEPGKTYRLTTDGKFVEAT